MIRALIIEDEPGPAKLLVSLLHNNFPEVEVLDVYKTVESSLEGIQRNRPDLVFMDVKLNDKECFDIITKLGTIDFEIIFITSFDQYYKQAFKMSAVDFIEKPVDLESLLGAIEKYKKRKSQSIDPRQIELLLSVRDNPALPLKKIAVPTMSGLDFIETDNIIYCEGASNQAIFYLRGKNKIFASMTLKECEDRLSNSNFQRVHKSYLVNLNHIEKYIKGKDGLLIMNGVAEPITVSREFKDSFLRRFKKH